jgi:hypothetical protein
MNRLEVGARYTAIFLAGDCKGAGNRTTPLSVGRFRKARIRRQDGTSHFVLDTATTKYRMYGATPDPAGKFLYAVTTEIVKQPDHFEVGMPKYTVIDVAAQKIVKTVEIDPEDLPGNTGFLGRFSEISTDGKYLYQFREKVAILDAATLKVVERLDLAKPEDPSMRHLGYGEQLNTLSRPGYHVSLFNAADPYVHHSVFGIARFNLDTRGVDFTPIGPAVNEMSGLQVAPDLKDAWTVATYGGELGNKHCEFWHFDLTTNKVMNKSEFPCRTNEFSNHVVVSGNGKKLYVYGNGFDIEVYDSETLKHVETWDLNSDCTGPLVILDRRFQNCLLIEHRLKYVGSPTIVRTTIHRTPSIGEL